MTYNLLLVIRFLRYFRSHIKIISAFGPARPDTLDPALLRSGRLDRKIELPHPNEVSHGDPKSHIFELNGPWGYNGNILMGILMGYFFGNMMVESWRYCQFGSILYYGIFHEIDQPAMGVPHDFGNHHIPHLSFNWQLILGIDELEGLDRNWYYWSSETTRTLWGFATSCAWGKSEFTIKPLSFQRLKEWGETSWTSASARCYVQSWMLGSRKSSRTHVFNTKCIM